jgi:hypothetical protein
MGRSAGSTSLWPQERRCHCACVARLRQNCMSSNRRTPFQDGEKLLHYMLRRWDSEQSGFTDLSASKITWL